MNEEEKRAIEWLKNATFFSARTYAPTILSLIDKQQQEIKELKKPKYLYNANTGEITKLENSEYISKDKIRSKIKEYEKLDKEEYAKQGNFETEISLLNELLEE